MDDLREAGRGDARHRGAPAPGTAAAAAAAARARRSSSPQRHGGGGGDRDAGEAGDGARDARRGCGAGKAEEAGGRSGSGTSRGAGGRAARSGVVARVGPGAEAEAGGNAGAAAVPAGGGAARVRAVVAAPREGSGGGKEGNKKRASASSAAPLRREGSGGGEVGTKKRPFASSSSAAAPRAYPSPKRRMVSAERHFPPGFGRGCDGADGGSRLVTTAPARPGGGSAASPPKPAAATAAARHPPRSVREAGSGGVLKKASAAVGGSRAVAAPARHGGASQTKHAAAAARRPPSVGKAGSGRVLKKASAMVGGSRVLAAPARRGSGWASSPTKPAAAPPRCSAGEAGSSGVLKKVPAAVVLCPVADGGRHGPHAASLKSLEPSRRSGVAAADGLLDIDSQGRSGRGGSGSSKKVVWFRRKPVVYYATRRFPPGRGRAKLSQPLNKSAEKYPKTESKDSSTSSDSFGPKKNVTVKRPDYDRLKIASACAMGSISTVNDLVDSILADDAFLKSEAAYQSELQWKLNCSSDARSKFKMICGRFQFICNAIVQFVQQRSLKISRIDIAAGKVVKKLPGFTQQGPVIGDVPGVEVGDEFLYKVQLAVVGLHRLPRKGIDSIKFENGMLVAISIVASGDYPDELSSSGELIYTGSGGKCAGKKSDENQKLKGGNLALKNCIQTKTPVRVIHGFKGREEGSHSKAKGASAFIYDGLYHVVDCWKEGQAGSKVFKYKLLRIPGQPELPHRTKTASGRKSGIMRWR
ncbi:unnamed protein product [Urochloa decumbens]|uniref:YDG domain-containing protein n=1 Tax=Urochloa decumbens TaxID=240449 RepID=A0ABC9BND4_9POAL